MSEEKKLKATVTKGGGESSYDGKFYSGEIEEDIWHLANLKKITNGEATFKGKTTPVWVWVYTLLGSEFSYKDDDNNEQQYIIVERTSQKLSTPPRASKAYTRYCQLMGKEPSIGEEIDLSGLFGKTCKLMIKNNHGDKIIFHNIEKVTIKGLDNQDKPKPSSKVEEKKEEDKKPSEDPVKDEEEDDIFKDLI